MHGFPDFSYLWRAQLSYFSEQCRVITPDLLGFNLSPKSANLQDYQLDNLVENLYEFIQSLNVDDEKISLVGHDWGGLLAWSFAMHYPELLEKLIIINAPHPIAFAKLLAENEAQQEASAYVKFLLQDNAASLLKANNYLGMKIGVLKRGMQEGWITENDVIAYEQAWSQDNAVECMLNYYKASFQVNDDK